MGNALQGTDAQFSYLKNRIAMLQDVVQSMDAPVEEEELKRVEEMILSLSKKVERFQQDREEGE